MSLSQKSTFYQKNILDTHQKKYHTSHNLIRRKKPSGAYSSLLLHKKDHKLLKPLLYQSIALYSTETDDTLASKRNSKCSRFNSFHGDRRYVCFRLDYNFNTDYSNCA